MKRLYIEAFTIRWSGKKLHTSDKRIAAVCGFRPDGAKLDVNACGGTFCAPTTQ